MEEKEKEKILSLRDLEVTFQVRGRRLTAIRGVDLDIYKGESLAIVGESGSGKSVLTKTFSGMLDSNGYVSNGTITYYDESLSDTVVYKNQKNIALFKFFRYFLNKNNHLELGSDIYNEIVRYEEEIEHKMTAPESVILENKQKIYDLDFERVELFNKKQTLDSKADQEEIAEINKKINELKIAKKAAIKEFKIIQTKNKESYLADTEQVSADKKYLADLNIKYKAAIRKKVSLEDKEKRNERIAKELVLSVARYPFRRRVIAVFGILRCFREAQRKGIDISNPDVLDNLYSRYAFRVGYLDELEYERDDQGKYVRITNDNKNRKCIVETNGEKTRRLEFDRNNKQVIGDRTEDNKKVRLYWHGTCKNSLEKFKLNRDWQLIRGKRISTVFQDPMTSLNPISTIGKQITDCILRHQDLTYEEATEKALNLLRRVGITDAEKRFNDYPFQYSGGMRQRIVIAIALSCEPEILICDEPTTALDVTIQAQIIRLIKDLQKELGFTIVFITHDLGVVANVADRVAVLYAGQVVEIGNVEEIFYEPKHPYTWALLSSLPQLSTRGETLYSISGTPPSLYNKINGDPFAPRNPYRMAIDFVKAPPMFKVSETHYAKTWLLDPRAPKVMPPKAIENIHEKLSKTVYTEINEEIEAENQEVATSTPATEEAPKSEEFFNELDEKTAITEPKPVEEANPQEDREAIISLKNVDITFGKGKNAVYAVKNATFDIYKGETFSLVGESGSGKTTIGRAIVRINPVANGEILYKGKKISGKISRSEDREVVRNIQMIFQDPAASLNERCTVEYLIAEGLDNFHLYESKKERMDKITNIVNEVGLLPEHLTRYSHEFSGGQRQRIGLARSIIMEPEVIIADEPISALDVSIRAQVLNLLKKFQRERGITYLFVAHDLSIVRFISDRIGVIYKGDIVEIAEAEELFAYPLHPYTKSLLSAIPVPDPQIEKNKKLFVYDPSVHHYETDKPSLQNIGHNHFVYCNSEEFAKYSRIRNK